MAAQIIFDQVGLGAGVAGKSRSDGLANGAIVTVTNASGNPCRVEWWWYPPDDTAVAATLVQNGPDEWQFDPTAARYGEYAVRMIEDEGLETETEDIKSFGIRLPTSNLLIPAFNSRGDYSVNRSSTTGEKNAAAAISFNNEPLPDDAAVNWANWWQSMNELFKYVESISPVVAVGIDPKESVRAVATSNVAALTGLAVTVDGVALNTVDMRVLLTAQTDATNNGIWLVKSGAWQRPLDFASGSNVASAFTFVEEGTTYADTGWVCTTDQPNDEVDADTLAWSQFTGGAGGGETLAQTLVLGRFTGADASTSGNPIHVSLGDYLVYGTDPPSSGEFRMSTGADGDFDMVVKSTNGGGTDYTVVRFTQNGCSPDTVWIGDVDGTGFVRTYIVGPEGGFVSLGPGAFDVEIGGGPSTASHGGSVKITGGDVGSGNGDGGDLHLRVGTGNGTGVDGQVIIGEAVRPAPLILYEIATMDDARVGAGKGGLWVRNDTPTILMFTDDAGGDWVVNLTAA